MLCQNIVTVCYGRYVCITGITWYDSLNINWMKVNFGHHVVLSMQKEQAFWWPWVTVPHIAPPSPARFKEALEAMVGKYRFSPLRVFSLRVHLVKIKKEWSNVNLCCKRIKLSGTGQTCYSWINPSKFKVWLKFIHRTTAVRWEGSVLQGFQTMWMSSRKP